MFIIHSDYSPAPSVSPSHPTSPPPALPYQLLFEAHDFWFCFVHLGPSVWLLDWKCSLEPSEATRGHELMIPISLHLSGVSSSTVRGRPSVLARQLEGPLFRRAQASAAAELMVAMTVSCPARDR